MAVAQHEATRAVQAGRCDLCGEHSGVEVLEKDGERYVQCSACGFVYVDPPPADYVEQSDASFTAKLGQYAAKSYGSKQQAADRRMLRRFAPYRRTNRLLEVGCNVGGFLDQARKQGWDAVGVEPVDACAGYGREEHGLNILTGRLEDAGLPDDTFDVVYSSAVLEHVPSPSALLQEIARVLRPGGVTYHATVNYDCYTRRFIGAGWKLLSPSGHPSLFTPATMRAFCTGAGLEVLRIHTRGVRLRPNAAARLRGLRRRLEEARKLPLSAAARVMNQGDTIFVMALKPDPQA